MMINKNFHAVVLAGSRRGADAVAEAAGTSCKALAPVRGRPMLLRVLDCLRAHPRISAITLVGPGREAIEQCAELADLVDRDVVQWLPAEDGPSKSAAAALSHIDDRSAVLLTTADHALLTPEIVEHFLLRADQRGADAVVALAEKDAVMRAFPDGRRTGLKFRDATYSGCNLFAFLTPQGRRVVTFWQRIEHLRKQPVKMLSAIGWLAALRYRLGRLSLAQAMQHLGHKTDTSLHAVIMPQAHAAVDVDSVNDWRLVNQWLSEQASEQCPSK